MDDSLPDALVGEILQHCSARELATAARVCRRFATAAEHAARGSAAMNRLPLAAAPKTGWSRALRDAELAGERHTIAAGVSHSIWIDDRGRLFASGRDPSGKPLSNLGLAQADEPAQADDSDDDYPPGGAAQLAAFAAATTWTPHPVASLAGLRVVEVSTGTFHGLALTDGGRALAFGLNNFGQCGYPVQFITTIRAPREVAIPQGERCSRVSCGAFLSFVITESGRAYPFGSNAYGELGLDLTLDVGSHHHDSAVEAAVRAGSDLFVDHVIWSVDYIVENDVPRPAARTLCRDTKFSHAASGRTHTLLLSVQGRAYACGRDTYGQLGLGGYSRADDQRVCPARRVRLPDGAGRVMQVIGLYKIFVYFEAVVHESTILSPPRPTCIAHPGAILLHDYCTVYGSLPEHWFVRYTPPNIGNYNLV